MDGPLIATIVTSTVVVGGAIGGGFWTLGRSIGRLEGKIDGMQTSIDQQSDRISNLEGRVNNIVLKEGSDRD